ncbi:MAG TPA: sigma-70 family RNA polymerase sigma factor, partial [Chitinophagaceae bacterium]|nr:sigma-70 family RNA polymerase sigma factor [Chitinophagaceae bacterium]
MANNIDFNKLVVNNSEFLKPFAVTLTRDSETAQDLYQETLYRAFINSDKYNVGTNLKAWLYTIMRNIFINDYRKKAKQNTVLNN